jgi:hypothetical protein
MLDKLIDPLICVSRTIYKASRIVRIIVCLQNTLLTRYVNLVHWGTVDILRITNKGRYMNALERFHRTGSADEWSTVLSMGPFKQGSADEWSTVLSMGPFKQLAVDASSRTSNTITSQQSNEHYYLRQ